MMVEISLTPTNPGWVDVVLSDFNRFLQDHASCEKKASGMALSLVSHYPDKPSLVNAMIDLAVEELSHYREVVRLLAKRGVTVAPDTRDTYVRQLNALVRRGTENYLLDRLLIASIIECRGTERFRLVAQALPAGAEKRFFNALSQAEARHWSVFLDLARQYCDPMVVEPRLRELTHAEAEIVASLPLEPRVH